jgi:hypothetical protein
MEGLPIAKAVSQHLEGIADVSIWNEGVFGLMEGNLENLVSVLDRFDFAVLVITADDTLIKREDTRQAPRDNIMFELGLFMGRLGRKRVFAMAPLIDRMHLPSDLAGVSLAIYNPFKDPSEAPRATRSACIRIENAILRRDGPIVPEDLIGKYKYRCSAANNTNFTHGGVLSVYLDADGRRLKIDGRRLWKFESRREDGFLICRHLEPYAIWRSDWEW